MGVAAAAAGFAEWTAGLPTGLPACLEAGLEVGLEAGLVAGLAWRNPLAARLGFGFAALAAVRVSLAIRGSHDTGLGTEAGEREPPGSARVR